MQSEGIDKFTFEVIDSVEYIDVEQLLIKESVLMNEYDSIETGYNTKHSVDLQNLYENYHFKFNNIRYEFKYFPNQNCR